MNVNTEIVYEYQVPQNSFAFDVEKVAETVKVYNENHPGLTLVIGHPFEDKPFLESVVEEQKKILNIFKKYHLDPYLVLYAPDQIHATILELAGQHDESKTEQKVISEEELIQSKKGTNININYALEWINQTKPFDVELGKEVLSEAHKDQTIRITPNGQIVMKGRAKERDLLAKIRGDFEDQANILHKYTRADDEFFFVIGYLKPSQDLNSPGFISELLSHFESRRKTIELSMKVSQVAVILYQQRTLDPAKCLKQWNFQLSKKPEISDLFSEIVTDTKEN